MANKVLITGAAGFIGASAVTKLHKSYKVIAAIRPGSDTWRLDGVEEKITIEETDLIKPRSVKKLFDKFSPDYVVHLATHGVYTRQKNDVKEILIGNLEMTYNLLQNSEKYNVKKFINSGSVFEYGSRYGKLKEEEIDITDVLNHYSASKFATTALAASFYESVPTITLRFFTAYGPKEDTSRFIRTTIQRAIKNEDLVLVKDTIRDFIYVTDISDGIEKSIKSDIKSEVINIGSGEKNTLEAVAKVIIELTKSNSKITFNDAYKRAKDSQCWADISKAKKLIDWEPKHTLENGIKKAVEWVRLNGS